MAQAFERSRARRAVLNDARRQVERALRLADVADDLAGAAEALIQAARRDPAALDGASVEALASALARYRALAEPPAVP